MKISTEEIVELVLRVVQSSLSDLLRHIGRPFIETEVEPTGNGKPTDGAESKATE